VLSVETARLFNKLEVYDVPLSADDENLSIYLLVFSNLCCNLVTEICIKLKLRISYGNKCNVEGFHCFS
jgi:hypothetical protein